MNKASPWNSNIHKMFNWNKPPIFRTLSSCKFICNSTSYQSLPGDQFSLWIKFSILESPACCYGSRRVASLEESSEFPELVDVAVSLKLSKDSLELLLFKLKLLLIFFEPLLLPFCFKVEEICNSLLLFRPEMPKPDSGLLSILEKTLISLDSLPSDKLLLAAFDLEETLPPLFPGSSVSWERKLKVVTTSLIKGRADGSSCRHMTATATAWFKLLSGNCLLRWGSAISGNLLGSLKKGSACSNKKQTKPVWLKLSLLEKLNALKPSLR